MSATAVMPDFERRTLSKVKWYMLTYLLLGQVFYQFDRLNISFAQLTMGKELHIDAKTFGFAASILFVSMFIMQFPSGMAFEKFGAKRWLTALMLGWGAVSVAQGFVHSPTQLSALRFLLGFFEAGYMPGVYIVISMWFRGKDHGLAMSATLAGVALSGILGGPFAGWILGKTFVGLVGWRLLFISEGFVTLVLAIFGWIVLADTPDKASWLKPKEQEFMTKYLGEYQAQKAKSGVVEKGSVWGCLKDSRIVLLLIGLSISGFSAQVFSFFMPQMLKAVQKGVSNQYIGLLMAIPWVAYGVVAYYLGKHADKTEPTRHWHTVLPVLISATAIFLFPLAKGAFLATLLLALVKGCTAGWFVNFWPVANMVAGRQTIVRSTALLNSGNMVANFAGPIVFGWMMDVTGSNKMGMYTCFTLLVLNFVLMNVFFFRYKAQQKLQSEAAVTAAVAAS